MTDSNQLTPPPDGPPRKLHLGLPADYWMWSEAKQRHWAAEAANVLHDRLLRPQTPEAERRPFGAAEDV